MRSPARIASQRRYAASAKGRAARAKVEARRSVRLVEDGCAEWTWRAYFHADNGRYPTADETAAFRASLKKERALEGVDVKSV